MTSRESESAEVRDSFVEALLRIYRTRPVSDVSVAELCAKAGYSRSTFYRYFDSLDQVHQALEERAVPTKAMEKLLADGQRASMEEITNLFLAALSGNRELYGVLFSRDSAGRFFDRLKNAMKPVFRTQAERAFDMTPFEYDVFAEYLTTAKLSLFRMWTLSPTDPGLAYITKITDATIESGLWDRVDESFHCHKAGKEFHRPTIDEMAASRPWVAYRYGIKQPDQQPSNRA